MNFNKDNGSHNVFLDKESEIQQKYKPRFSEDSLDEKFNDTFEREKKQIKNVIKNRMMLKMNEGLSENSSVDSDTDEIKNTPIKIKQNEDYINQKTKNKKFNERSDSDYPFRKNTGNTKKSFTSDAEIFKKFHDVEDQRHKTDQYNMSNKNPIEKSPYEENFRNQNIQIKVWPADSHNQETGNLRNTPQKISQNNRSPISISNTDFNTTNSVSVTNKNEHSNQLRKIAVSKKDENKLRESYNYHEQDIKKVNSITNQNMYENTNHEIEYKNNVN